MCRRVAWLSWAFAALACAAAAAAQEPPGVPPAAAPLSEARRDPVRRLEEVADAPRGERERAADEIETDRDSFTPATSTAPRAKFILESAYTFLDNRGAKETHSFPEVLLRYGLTERVELRLGWNAEIGGAGNDASGTGAADEDPTRIGSRLIREYTLAYGLKVSVTDQDRWRPASALILQAFTPTGGNAGTSTATQLVATYVAGWAFPNRWKFDAAVRYGTGSESGDHFNQWAPSAVLKVPLGEKVAGHIEYFGLFTAGKEQNVVQHYVSPGLHYLVTSNLEVGFRLGWGLNDQTPRFFSNVGLGWRF